MIRKCLINFLACIVSYCHHFSSVVHPSTFHILIFSSETTGPIATKLWWNGPWVAPSEKCVRWSWLPTKMATKLKIEKRGDEIIKKSSPLKLLSQSQPSFAEIILGWSPSKIVSGISDIRPRWLPQPFRTLWEIPIKIFLSETICSIRTKFWRKSHWMVLFQNCVQRFGPLTKMAEQLNLV
jgi:hypothetical protein